MPEEPTPGPAEPAPVSLRTALLLLGAQTVVLALLTVLLIYAALAGGGSGAGTAVGTIVFTALLAALLGWFTWALFRRRAWARGPAITIELLLVPIGVTMIGGGLPGIGIPTIILGLVGAGSLIAPTTREALGRK
jgi:hypothetical protein